MSGWAIVAARVAGIVVLIAAAASIALFETSADAEAQEFSLEARVATWMSSDGVLELCFDLRDAIAGETRLCPDRRMLRVARAPENRWLRTHSTQIGPETGVWIRVRRLGERLELGLALTVEGRARGIRRTGWVLDWASTPTEQWQRTSTVPLQLPVAPHPELWQSEAGIAVGARRLEVGRTAPEFILPRLGGADDSLISLSAARAGGERLTLIVFWSSWAPLVGETLSVLGDLAVSEPDVRVIGINVYEVDPEAGEAFIRNFGTGLLHLVDVDGSVAQHYRVDGVPELFVLDADGVYRGVIRGAAPLTEILSALYGVE